MLKYLKVLSVFAAIALVAACQKQEADQTGTTEETAVTDTESIRQGIEGINDQFEQAIIAGDPVTLTNFYADDAVVLAPNMPRAEGREAITSFWTSMINEGGAPATATLTTDQVIVPESGEIAVEIGTYTVGGTAPDGTTWEDTGKYMASWENVNGEWKMAADTWNSDVSLPGMEGTAPAEKMTAPAGTTEPGETN